MKGWNMISKLTVGAILAVLSVIIGAVLALSAIADLIELTMPASALEMGSTAAYAVDVTNDPGAIAGDTDHERLQPAVGARFLLPTAPGEQTYNPQITREDIQ
jgi:hypothetical protein